MIFISYCVAGVFALDQEKKVVASALFPKDPEKIIEKMNSLEKGVVTEELENLLKKIKDKDIVTDITSPERASTWNTGKKPRPPLF